jgi:hypothetical protein
VRVVTERQVGSVDADPPPIGRDGAQPDAKIALSKDALIDRIAVRTRGAGQEERDSTDAAHAATMDITHVSTRLGAAMYWRSAHAFARHSAL